MAHCRHNPSSMENRPLVSIIIPTYNREKTLPCAIRSALAQTYGDIEIVVVDDGSNDRTREVVERFDDKRISYIRHTRNLGSSAARNTAIRATTSPIIGFLDSDDEWLPEKLSRQVALLKASPADVGIVYGGFFFHKAGRVGVKTPKAEGYLFPEITWRNLVGPIGTAIFRRECFINCGMFNENLQTIEDWEIYMRVVKRYRVRFVSEPVLRYHIHPDSCSYNFAAKIVSTGILLDTYYDYIRDNREGHSEYYRRIGWMHCMSGNIKPGRSSFLKALKVFPGNLKAYLHLICSAGGADFYRQTAPVRALFHKMSGHPF